MIAALRESGLPFSLQTLFGTKAGKEAVGRSFSSVQAYARLSGTLMQDR